MNNQASLAFIAVILVSTPVFSEERHLTKAQVIEVFTDVTFDGIYLPKNKSFTAYDAPDGTLVILRANGNKDTGRRWYVNDAGQRCATSPKWDEDRCFDVFDAGNGTYHQYRNGKHLHTLTNFRKGNHL